MATKTLILIDTPSHTLSLFADAIASSFPFPASIQVIPAADVSKSEWHWADCVILGFSYSGARRLASLQSFLASLSAKSVNGKGLAIFQVQSRWDPPIAAAYGFALARDLRSRGMALVAPPQIFFRSDDDRSETEGELLRSTLWLGSLVNQILPLLHKEKK